MIRAKANTALGYKALATWGLVAAILATLAFAAPAWAATYTVNRHDDPVPNPASDCKSRSPAANDCSLREAVLVANSNPGADTILLPGGTYTLTIANNPISQGDLDVSENLDIKSTGPGAATINGNGTVTGDRVLQVEGGALSLFGVNVEGGIAPSEANGNHFGGGVRVDSGAFYMYGGDVRGNSVPGVGDLGGGIYTQGHTVLHRVEISGNTATGGPGGFGGGIYTGGNGLTEIYDSKFFDNLAQYGGALASASGVVGGVSAASVNVVRSQLGFNQANVLGGAAFVVGSPASGGINYNFTNATVNNNTAGGSDPDSGAGAIRVRDATVNLTNSTVTRNTAKDGGGIAAKDDGNNVTSVTLADTILAGNLDSNHADGNNPDCVDPDGVVATHFQTQGYNIVGNVEGCFLHPINGDQFGTSISPVDPLLDPSEHFNGGAFVRVFTDALLPGSPAIDKGDPSGGCEQTDARGVPRTAGGRCDIGAYELVKLHGIVVNRVGTFGDDSSSTPELTPTAGADGFLGLDGNDSLKGAGGNDALSGGNGNDTLSGGPGADFITCGPGVDRVFADQLDKVAGDCEHVM
jgi:RTX calcium-binding nonapeptide repeat (4 copies)